MALFTSHKKEIKEKKPRGATLPTVKDANGKLAGVLLAPWLSEKALIATERGIYTFHIPMTATKQDVAFAV